MTALIHYKQHPSQIQSQGRTYVPVADDVRRLILEHAGDRALSLYIEATSHATTFNITARMLAKRLNWNAKTVTKYLKRLRELGLACIHKIRDTKAGKFVGSRYQFSQTPREEWKMAEVQTDFFSDNRDTTLPTIREAVPEKNHDEVITNINFLDSAPHDAQEEPVTEEATESEQKTEFARFWEVYPRKLDRARALRVFKRVTKGMSGPELTHFTENILRNVLARTHYDAQWLRTIASNKGSIPYAKTYLSAERWHDEFELSSSCKDLDLQKYVSHGGSAREYFINS